MTVVFPIVDFLLRSVEDVLVNEFKTSLSAENVHLIDPFTGTGTFIVRLLQLGIIKPSLHRRSPQTRDARQSGNDEDREFDSGVE